jgi:hypothetical protein
LIAFKQAREMRERDPSPQTVAVLETGLQCLVQELQRRGKFKLDQLVMTRGASETIRAGQQVPLEFLLWHKNGDWSELPEEDVREREWSL